MLGIALMLVGLVTTTGLAGGWWWTNHHTRQTTDRQADDAIAQWAQRGHPGKLQPISKPGDVTKTVIAVVRAPRLGAKWRMPVHAGTGTQVLRHGLGLYAGSPHFGALGNVALAGHRTTWGAPLRHLDRMRAGDLITVWTAEGRFDYRVTRSGVTRPSDGSVIRAAAAHGSAMLTMTTCTPEFSARQRLYIHAVLIKKTAYSEGVSTTG